MVTNYYAKRTDWYPVKNIGPNISFYIYNDVNRNGIYDVEDRPMMKIAVKMTRPDGSWVIRRSNLNGFANFRHSLTADNVEVKEPGEYIFEVIVPDGWEVTSNNRIQVGTYREAPETRPGIVIDKVPEPVGIAPILTVSGTVKVREARGSVRKATPNDVIIQATSPAGNERFLTLDEEGNFSFIGEPGIWKITFESKSSNARYERVIEVGNTPVKMSSIVLGDEEIKEKKPVQHIVDFEDITDSFIQKVPNGVAGLNWDNLIVVHNNHYRGEGYKNGTVSGKFVGYNSSGHPVTISLEDGFDFYGGYFSVAWLDNAEGETLEVRAWRGEELVVDEEYILSALGPFWLDADYRQITKLELSTKHYWQFVVDDIKVGV